MASSFQSGDAIMATDSACIVRTWNVAAERMLGISADQVIGRPCWEALGASGEDGSVICHPRCSRARLAATGRPMPSQRMLVRAGHNGRKLVDVATVNVRDRDDVTCVHVLREADAPVKAPPTKLTSRQSEVLSLLAEGRRVKQIARDLDIAEVTVRNHVRAILVELRVRSQLEAVVEARRRRLL